MSTNLLACPLRPGSEPTASKRPRGTEEGDGAQVLELASPGIKPQLHKAVQLWENRSTSLSLLLMQKGDNLPIMRRMKQVTVEAESMVGAPECQLHPSVLSTSNGTPLQYSCLENPMDGGAWWAAVHGIAKSRARLSNFLFTFHLQALEKETVTHSSLLVWRIPGTGEPGGLPSMGSHRVGHD